MGSEAFSSKAGKLGWLERAPGCPLPPPAGTGPTVNRLWNGWNSLTFRFQVHVQNSERGNNLENSGILEIAKTAQKKHITPPHSSPRALWGLNVVGRPNTDSRLCARGWPHRAPYRSILRQTWASPMAARFRNRSSRCRWRMAVRARVSLLCTLAKKCSGPAWKCRSTVSCTAALPPAAAGHRSAMQPVGVARGTGAKAPIKELFYVKKKQTNSFVEICTTVLELPVKPLRNPPAAVIFIVRPQWIPI